EKASHRLDAQESADWLGFRVTRVKDRLAVGVGERAWERLEEKLAHAQEEPDAPVLANAIIKGWVSQLGPAYGRTDRAEAYARLKALAAEQAFDEIPGPATIERFWQRAHAR